MWIRQARRWPEGQLQDVEIHGSGEVDARGAWMVPSFVDLACDPGFPGFPAREDVVTLGAAAVAGGFGDLVTSPRQEPILDTPEHFADLRRTTPQGVRLWPAAAATRGLEGRELTEVGLLSRVGVSHLSDGGRPIVDTVVLRNLLEYARAFDATVLLRPACPFLDELGCVHESPLAARLGLRGNPAANEEVGLGRILALVRSTGARVHVAPIATARGVALLRAAREEGLPVTGAAAARSLLLDESTVDDGTYDTRYRLRPPLRGAEDREALLEAVRDGTLWLCADHQPRAPEEKELEFERAVEGSTGLESAFASALTALGDLDVVVRALSVGPSGLLRACTPGVTLVDTEAEGVVDARTHRSRGRNDALHGRTLRGLVVGSWPEARFPGGGGGDRIRGPS